jgi:putative Mn2+ efflux pump MntP
MNFAEILGIGLALGVDCLAVSAGIGCSKPSRGTMALVAALFGLFQFGMAVGGMYGGATLEALLHGSLRLAAPILIGTIGVLMIWKGLKCEEPSLRLAGILAIMGASVSVSLDALGAGVALGLVGQVSVAGAVLIGLVSVGMSAAGFAGGRMLARHTGLAEDIGGGFLILLAVVMFLTQR